MASRYKRNPKPKSVGAADLNDAGTSGQPRTPPTKPSHARATSSHRALDRNDAATAVTVTLKAPTRSTGDPPVTYHADRHRNP